MFRPKLLVKPLSLLLCFLMLIGAANYNKNTAYAASATDKTTEATTETKKGKETITINGKCIWNDEDNKDKIRPEYINVRLMANNEVVVVKSITAADDWKYSFEDLNLKKDDKEISYSIKVDPVVGYDSIVEGYDVTNIHKIGETSFPITVMWNDSNDADKLRPESVTVYVTTSKKDGESVNATSKTIVDEKSDWTTTESGIPMNGVKVKVKIKGLPDSYEQETTGSIKEGYKITCTHKPKNDVSADSSVMKNVNVLLNWQDENNADGIRPNSVDITLNADGKEIANQTITAETGWTHTFENLPQYNEKGKEIDYKVLTATIADYIPEYNGDNITLMHDIAKTNIGGNKEWDDNDNASGRRPEESMVRLLANNVVVDTQTINEKNGWSFIFKDVPMYSNGEKIEYTVDEKTDSYTEGYPYVNEIETDEASGLITIKATYVGTTSLSPTDDSTEIAQNEQEKKEENENLFVQIVFIIILVIVILIVIALFFTGGDKEKKDDTKDKDSGDGIFD